jgi:hypothetical protein
MIDTTRIPPNVGIHEYLMLLDEPRERPIPQREYPEDHSRRDWILYERAILKQIEDMPQADELIRCLLVTAKKRDEVKRELEGVLSILKKEKR